MHGLATWGGWGRWAGREGQRPWSQRVAFTCEGTCATPRTLPGLRHNPRENRTGRRPGPGACRRLCTRGSEKPDRRGRKRRVCGI